MDVPSCDVSNNLDPKDHDPEDLDDRGMLTDFCIDQTFTMYLALLLKTK